MLRKVRLPANFWALALGSIGVVFGDIGTSPLYAFREAAAAAAHGEPITRGIVLGVLSLILWALFIVVTAQICPPAASAPTTMAKVERCR